MTASDISPSLLAAAEDAGSADRYVLADATSLPFDAHSFDRVVAYNVLMDVPDILPRCLNPHACSHRTAS